MAAKLNWIDRAIAAVSPAAGVARLKARVTLARAEYDGASQGRRAAGWKRRVSDPNAELNPLVLSALRGIAQDLVRNNAWGASAVAKIAEQTVGPGITFHVTRGGKFDQRLTDLARAHFDSTACDAEGRHNLYGLQLQAMRTIPTAGAVLARRRWRRMNDGLPVPFQIQLLEPDYLAASLTSMLQGGGYRIAGIEFDSIGRRVGYMMHSGHPGAVLPGLMDTRFVPASEIAHVYRADRPEQQHGATWFAPVIVRMKDAGEYFDAQLIRQKVGAAFTAFRIGDPDGDPPPTVDGNGNPIEVADNEEYLEPGMIYDLPGTTDVKFGTPPGIEGYAEVQKLTAHEIAAGLGVPYEMLTGDLSEVSFISGRLGRLVFKRAVETWQWTMFIPQFCEPAGRWFLEAAAMMGEDVTGCAFAWSPPQFEMMDPASEVPATIAAIRGGLMNPNDALRERGIDPDTFWNDRAAQQKLLDKLGIILDSDARHVTQAGNPITSPMQTSPAPTKGKP